MGTHAIPWELHLLEPWGTAEEGYHFSEDMVDKAIAWLQGIHTMTPDKPFFLYTSLQGQHMHPTMFLRSG